MRLPIRMGVAYPRPTSTFHLRVSRSGHDLGSVNDAIAPSRFGPRHCGQSPGRLWPVSVAVAAARIEANQRPRHQLSRVSPHRAARDRREVIGHGQIAPPSVVARRAIARSHMRRMMALPG